MRIEPLLCTALLSIGLGACAQTPATKDIGILSSIPSGVTACISDPGTPNTGDCIIELRVRPMGTDSCEITLVTKIGGNYVEAADLDLVSLKATAPQVIYWKIVDSDTGYRFTHDGIAFVDNFKPRAFRDGERLEDTEFKWTKLGNKRRVNGYVISIKKPKTAIESARECELDPWIRNRGR